MAPAAGSMASVGRLDGLLAGFRPARLGVGQPPGRDRCGEHEPVVLVHPHDDDRRRAARLEHLGGHRDRTEVGGAEEVGGDGERVGREARRVGVEAGQRGPGEQHQQQAAVRLGADGPAVAQLGAVPAVAERLDRDGGAERGRGDTRLHDP